MATKRLRTIAAVAEEQLKTGAKRLRGRLVEVKRAAGRLAGKARKAKERRPHADASPGPDSPPVASGLTTSPAASPADNPAGSPVTDSGPDDSWTVAGLREEARRRGMSGYSRKTKAQLLAELRG